MKHIDLFSGIGGFAYAVDQVFHEKEIQHTFVENDPFCQAVLKKHWPEAEIHGDIKQFVADTQRTRLERSSKKTSRYSRFTGGEHGDQAPFILTGGFPCQPFSHAGRRKGTADDRYLWPPMFEAVTLFRPRWIIAENVAGLASWNEGLVLETVCSDLESEGYEVQPFVIPAAAVGAPHRRDRVWIVGHACNARLQGGEQSGARRERIVQREKRAHGATSEQYNDAPHPGSKKSQRISSSTRQEVSPSWDKDWLEVAFATCHDGVDDGLSYRLDGATMRGKRTDTISASKHREERLKACGNAIVPQVAMKILEGIKYLERN